MSAKVAREIFLYFTYPVDVNVTLHTLKLKMAVDYEVHSYNNCSKQSVPRAVCHPVTCLCLPVDEMLISIYLPCAYMLHCYNILC